MCTRVYVQKISIFYLYFHKETLNERNKLLYRTSGKSISCISIGCKKN